jgi:nicotinamide-nucleotide adenylyltransferase
MRSLVIGRFQPLHLGHIRMIEAAAERSTFLVIGIGSCNSASTLENPFTAEEREEMVKASLDLGIPYEMKRIPDFQDNGKWIGWIRENISFDALLTNSPNEKGIFGGVGVKVEDLPFFDRELYSATEVRRRMLEDGDWATLLPQGTIKVLSTIDGIFRVKKLASR